MAKANTVSNEIETERAPATPIPEASPPDTPRPDPISPSHPFPSPVPDQDKQTAPESRPPVLVYASGRGNSGKSTAIRWMVERAIQAGRSPVIADCDRNNQTLTAFFGADQVDRPPAPDDDTVTAHLMDLVNQQEQQGVSVALDMGGGDLVFPRFAATHSLTDALEAGGIRPVALHFLGTDKDDLSALQQIESTQTYCPEATALVFNAGLIRDTRSIEVSFAEVREHSVFRAAVDRGARVVVMPKLPCMMKLVSQRMSFAAGASGIVAPGQTPLGFMEKQLVKGWLRAMEEAFKPIEEWLP